MSDDAITITDSESEPVEQASGATEAAGEVTDVTVDAEGTADVAVEPEVALEPSIDVTTEPVTETAPEPVTEVAPEASIDVTTEPVTETAPEPAIDVTPEPVTVPVTEPVAQPISAPSPAAIPRPAAPSPAALARLRPRPPVVAPPAHSESARHGRVGEDGTVYVIVGDEERAVGSYPGATPDEALQYFARKYDELVASADVLTARVANPEVTAKEVNEALTALREHIGDAQVVGDLPALESQVAAIEAGIAAKRETEGAARAAARAAAATERERIVAEAEALAAQPSGSTQWKNSGERMRALLDEWKTHQRGSARLDKPTETALWQRFSAARNHFDKARRTWFAELESTRADAKSTKQDLVAQAESLASSTDWAATARAFKQLMDQWRLAGRAARGDDDALWERFRAAQDAFFQRKDAIVAAEDEEYRANLAVKEALLVEAEAILPITDLEAAKASLRSVQDRWDRAGKVPRADIERVEKGIRRVETAVREAEDRKWKVSNPEVAARARSLVDQLEAKIAGLRADLEAAQAAGNAKKTKDLTADIAAQQSWLDLAKGGLED